MLPLQPITPLPPGVPVGDLVVGTALAVGLFVYLRRSPVGRPTVVASVPWAALAVALHALRGVLDYPAVVAPALERPWVYPFVAALAGLAWVFIGSMLAGRPRVTRPHYFGMLGVGALLPPATVLVVGGDVTAPTLLVGWLVVPLLASLVTYVVMIGMGLWLPDAGYFGGLPGAVVVFALAVDGIGRALAFGVGGAAASPAGLDTLAAALGYATPVTVVSAAVWLRLAAAIAVIGVLTALARRRPQAAERGLELTTVVAGLVAANTFLLTLGGGFA